MTQGRELPREPPRCPLIQESLTRSREAVKEDGTLMNADRQDFQDIFE